MVKVIITCLGVLMLALFIARAVRRHRRWKHRHARCARCGYSLAGLNEPRCPECGGVDARDEVGKVQTRRRLLVEGVWLLVAVVLTSGPAWIPFITWTRVPTRVLLVAAPIAGKGPWSELFDRVASGDLHSSEWRDVLAACRQALETANCQRCMHTAASITVLLAWAGDDEAKKLVSDIIHTQPEKVRITCFAIMGSALEIRLHAVPDKDLDWMIGLCALAFSREPSPTEIRIIVRAIAHPDDEGQIARSFARLILRAESDGLRNGIASLAVAAGVGGDVADLIAEMKTSASDERSGSRDPWFEEMGRFLRGQTDP